MAAVIFNEEWFCQQSQDALAKLADRTAGLAGAVIEVGCWEGRSTVALADAVYPEVVHAVDTWEGSPGEPSWELAHDRDVYATFSENTDGLNIKAHRMPWQSFFDAWAGPVRFCHIDAEHTYEQVRGNIEAVLPYLVDGGVLCGDDAHHPPVLAAATEVLGTVNRAATLWWWQK